MNSKNIKKSLNAKMEDWLKHVDNKEIEQIIRDNAIITGGAIVSLLTGEEVHDYDVYFRTKESCLAVANYYVNKFNATHGAHATIKVDDEGRIQVFIQSSGIEGDPEENGITDESEPMAEPAQFAEDPDPEAEKPKYRPVFLSTNAISLSDKIQIVIRFYGSPEEIHKNYDFIHCTCWYSFLDNSLELPAKALEAIINKELYYVGSRYPLCSIIRTRKFINRGWTINAGQYLKMCLQLNELNLKDINVFKDQLVGVDSAYFMQAIEQIQEKQEKEPDFKIDNTYLFEIINRIF
jgi:hypothetical protein